MTMASQLHTNFAVDAGPVYRTGGWSSIAFYPPPVHNPGKNATPFATTDCRPRDLGDAVYTQVARQMRQLVASGALPPGTAIPPVRQLARDLGVSLNTVARAYRLLEAEGFLSIRDRAGVTVAAPAEEIDDSARGVLMDELRAILGRLRQAGMTNDDLLQVLRREVEALDGESRGEQE